MPVERDELGFLSERCEHCNARLYLGDWKDAKVICLNGCHLPGYLYRILMNLERIELKDITSDGNQQD